MDKKIIFAATVVVAVGGVFWLWQSGVFSNSIKPVPIPEGIILFYGKDCPHCKVVDDFISQNSIKDKVSFTNLEVWYNKDNQNILAQVVQKCGLKTDEVGVPFLWDGSKCYIGQDDVIKFFKEKAGI